MIVYIGISWAVSICLSILAIIDAYSYHDYIHYGRREKARKSLWWIAFAILGPLSIPLGILYYIGLGIYTLFNDAFLPEQKD